jgi:hypothetical protein
MPVTLGTLLMMIPILAAIFCLPIIIVMAIKRKPLLPIVLIYIATVVLYVGGFWALSWWESL